MTVARLMALRTCTSVEAGLNSDHTNSVHTSVHA